MVYLDKRANSYYQNGNRSSVNGPVDYRRMWRGPTIPPESRRQIPDAALAPVFGKGSVDR